MTWAGLAVSAAGFAIAFIWHVVTASFRFGETDRRVTANEQAISSINRMLGLENGAASTFLRADVADARFGELARNIEQGEHKIDVLVAETRMLRDAIAELKLLIAKHGG
jgi:hypothetical protein